MKPKRWVFISPHLDDAALSCGGLIARLTSSGVECVNITLTAGTPGLMSDSALVKEVQSEWGISDPAEAVAARKVEDNKAMRALGCGAIHLNMLDAIYRQDTEGHYLYSSIFDPIHPFEADLPARITKLITPFLHPDDQLVFPLAVGGHIDHVLARATADAFGKEVLYYIDVPYCFKPSNEVESAMAGFQAIPFEFSEADAQTWIEAISCYTSQLSSLFEDEQDMLTKIFEYFSRNKGIILLRKGS